MSVCTGAYVHVSAYVCQCVFVSSYLCVCMCAVAYSSLCFAITNMNVNFKHFVF